MPAVRRILIAVKDPGAKSLPAVTKGAHLARAYGASLELFHAITEPVLADAYFYVENGLKNFQHETQARHVAQLEKLAAPLREGGLDVTVSVTWDFPAHEAIVRQARRRKAGLIVAECHTGRRLAPWMLHLTDWELLRTSPLPVLLVKNAQGWERPVVLASVDPTHAFAKPAKLDTLILKEAASLSSALGGSLHAMHAYVPVPIGAAPSSGTIAGALTEVAAASASRAKTGFDRVVSRFDIPRTRQHLVQGQAMEAVPRTARELGAGIVVMGAISRSGIKRMLIGNTAERVLNALTCDVLVVKPERFKVKVPRKGRGTRYVGLPQVGVPV